MDEATRPLVQEGAFDEIFVGRTPVLMGVEPASLCWMLGQLAEDREGPRWAAALKQFPSLEHVITDAGSGLLSGLKLTNASRSKPLTHSLDVFHTVYEGNRAWRITESQLWKLHQQSEGLWKPLRRLRREGYSLSGHVTASHYPARQRAEEALQSAVQIETAWRRVRECLELFTPEGQLNHHAAAEAKLNQWLPGLKGPQWAKTVRLLKRPESLTFLKRVEQKLHELPIGEEPKREALRWEGLRRRPKLREGDDPVSRANRGWWLLATVRYHRDEAFRKAVLAVRGLLRRCWRASSLVEGINSVVRMQQARHRKLTPNLLNLKRFYWNYRRFRTGHRRDRSPYELLGLRLPDLSWWELLKLSPERLKQELSTEKVPKRREMK